MKVKMTVSTAGKRISVDVDEKQADKTFWGLAEKLMLAARQEKGEESVKEQEEQPKEQINPEKEDMPEEEDYCTRREGYTGFLLIKCSHCGKTKAFCSKFPLTHYKCECGEKTELNDLHRLYITCECGKKYGYRTNIQEPVLDVNCINCGAPVAVQWNSKKELYETIRG